jgi:uroporphyrinogen decarboxylase
METPITSRQRVVMALDHREPDRVPLDFGATGVTGIHSRAYGPLRAALGLPPVQGRISDTMQQLAALDEDLVERLAVDVRGVGRGAWDNLDIRETPDASYYRDDFGITWKMPKGGWYFDMVGHPLAGDAVDEAIRHYRWPSFATMDFVAGVAESARAIIENEQRAVILGALSAGVMEMAIWARGFEEFYEDLAADPKRACYLMDGALEMKMDFWSLILPLLGDAVDVVEDGDDLGSELTPLISPEMYRALIKPRHKRLLDCIHENTRAKVFFHSCGAIRPLIPDLIEVGVDILNPVQVSAAGMDSAALKRDFGSEMTFWGGGVDTQRVLSRQGVEAVRTDVRRRLDDLMPGGGFVFAPVHNIQGDVPAENIMAMLETLQEYGVYHGDGGSTETS